MAYRDVLGFSITPFMQRVMDINGFFASIMRTGKKSENSNTKLPPGVPIPVLPVDYLKVKPDSWICGQGAFVCPVNSDWALWFNFSMNNPNNTAILPSVKGMNPLTGMRTEGYNLESYKDECPIHKITFSKGKLCTECGFKWPEQNYLSKPNQFYIDGFRTPSCVRQFYFTEDMAMSVPELVIGKEDTVPAFGFCFYKLKDFKPNWEEGNRLKNKFPEGIREANHSFLTSDSVPCFGSSSSSSYGGVSGYSGLSGAIGYAGKACDAPGSIRSRSFSKKCESTISARVGSTMDSFSFRDMSPDEMSTSVCYLSASASSIEEPIRGIGFSDALMEAPMRKSAEVGIGAGAKIKQDFEKSKNSVEDWENKPAGVIRIYFVFQEEFERYASAGFNSLEGNESGYLEGVPVGGSHE